MPDFLMSMNLGHFESYQLTVGGDDNGFVPIDHAFCEGTVELRRQEIEGSR
ncbi:MAG: hypothetical protein ACXIU8_15530 [Alkalilacustris sp.]